MRREAVLRAVIAASLLMGGTLFHPADPPWIRLCGFYQLTHFDCPLCGLTRGICALLHGEWRQALRFHPLAPLALAWLGGLLAVSLASAGGWEWAPPAAFRSRLLRATGLLFLACWPLRLTGVV